MGTASALQIGFAVCSTLLACCSNVVLLEAILKYSKGAGTLVTLLQFLFISSIGFIFTAKLGSKKPDVPVLEYMKIVLLFFGSSLSANAALAYNISMPLQMIFKSGSLLANMILSVLVLKRSYTWQKYLSVGMISVGITICTLMSARPSNSAQVEFTYEEYMKWLWGIFLLVAGLLMAARLGIYQEQLASKYGKHPQEMLFYSHALSLPGFLLLSRGIQEQVTILNQTELLDIFGLSVPTVWWLMLLNVLTQYICARSVYLLVTEMSSLSVTVVLTLRKFVSLLISIFYFKNPFTMYHWIGAVLVFGGSLLFTGVLQSIYGLCAGRQTEAEKKKDE